ncbi:MAG: anhydro-N-acetylmuramic acid kinase [Chloroflexota bacterium]
MNSADDGTLSRPLVAVGLMCGTSIDAVDAVVVEITGSGAALIVKQVAFISSPVHAPLRARILRACLPGGGSTRLICELNAEIGEAFAEAALAAIAAARLRSSDVDVIGSHGQTVWHQGRADADIVASTLQLGEPSIIAERTGITTVADYRPRDMAAGGQGAPLVSYLDWALYRSATEGRALQNIGGIANVTVVPADCLPDDVFAFDTGPGNMLIDAMAGFASDGAFSYDQDGRLALAGAADEALLARILTHPFFTLTPPRTAGREQFGVAYAHALWQQGRAAGISSADILATITLATARSIAAAYRHWILPRVHLDAMYLSGGGARNPALRQALRQELPELPQQLLTDLGGDMQAKEAIAFAVLAAETLRGVPTSFPGATGARHAAVLGKIVPGANWRPLQRALLLPEAATHPADGARGRPAETSSSLKFPLNPEPGQVTIGIDGGGTKTAAVAIDGSGIVVARVMAGPSNFRAAGWAAAMGALQTVLEQLAVALPPGSTVVGVHAALAGAGRPEDAPPLQAFLLQCCQLAPVRPLCEALQPGDVAVSNDALAVLAAASATTGLVVIAGTGSFAWGRSATGETARAGGWGFLLGDGGSGFDLGRRALMAVLAGHDAQATQSSLSAALLQQLGLTAPPELVARIYGSADARTDIASLAPVVLQQIATGDAVATALVLKSVADLAGQVRTVDGHLQFGDAPRTVVCSGGLFTNDPFFRAFQEALGDPHRFQCVRSDRSPAEGAALLAWHRRALAEGARKGHNLRHRH